MSRTLTVYDVQAGAYVQDYDPTADLRGYDSLGETPGGRSSGLGGEMNAFYPDLTVTPGQNFDGDSINAAVLQDKAAATGAVPNTGNYLHLNGQIVYVGSKENPDTGVYFQRLGGDSWPPRGHAVDQEGTPQDPKKYSKEQALRWMDVTTLDKNQRPVFCLLHANEKGTEPDTLYSQMQDLTSKYDSICSTLGLPDPYYLFLHAHMAPQATTYKEKLDATRLAAAYYSFAKDHSRTGYYSIFDWSNGIRLDGDTKATEWVEAKGIRTVRMQRRNEDTSLGLIDNRAGELVSDGIHPNSGGDRTMGLAVANALKAAM
jgi:hypothetical protein